MITGFRFKNRKTGELIDVTLADARLGRMRKRLRAWDRATKLISGVDLILCTLTYRNLNGWSSRHISDFMRRVRRFCGDALFAYAWVAELQRRGAVHYHLLLIVRRGLRLPKPDESGWWGHGMTKIERVSGRSRGYLMKYAQKGSEENRFPVGLRLFAVVVRRALTGPAWELKWHSAPSWLHLEIREEGRVVAVGEVLRRVVGGFVVGDRIYRSPWALESVLREGGFA